MNANMLVNPNGSLLAKCIWENKNEIHLLESAVVKPNWVNGSCEINIISLAKFSVFCNVGSIRSDASDSLGIKKISLVRG